MFYLVRLLIVATYVSAIGYSTSVSGQSAPARVSDIVARFINIQQVTPACTPDLEIGFIGLAVPSNQVLLLTGLFWGASSHPGFLIEADIYVTDGNPVNRNNIARVSGTAAANGFFSGIQSFPVYPCSGTRSRTYVSITQARLEEPFSALLRSKFTGFLLLITRLWRCPIL
jgi:hypothetical protein